MKRVALVKMPWYYFRRGSSAVGIIKSTLVNAQIPTDVYYLNLRFLKYVNPDTYMKLSNNSFLGDWAFGQHLFGKYGTGELKKDYDDLLSDCMDSTYHISLGLRMRKMEKELKNIVDVIIPKFLDECMNNVPWGDYSAVAFIAAEVPEHLSSIVLSRRIKEKYPDIKIILGGNGVKETIGKETVRSFEWMDYAIDGEEEEAVLPLVRNILSGDSCETLPGVSYRRDGEIVSREGVFTTACLDHSPVPDYTDYYRELEECGFQNRFSTAIMFESSRGCSWNDRVHCTFCGANPRWCSFRIKSADRFFDEITTLSNQYGTKRFYASDKMLDMNLLDAIAPKLQEADYKFFYMIRPDVSREQLVKMHACGIIDIHAGIESLSAEILKKMRKGVTAIQNVQLLKICSEMGINVNWNILYGFPGEKKSDYDDTLKVILLITHLQPPTALYRILLLRNSLLFIEPGKYGVKDVRPNLIYNHIYPPGKVNISDIAFFFEFSSDSFEGDPEAYFSPVGKTVNRWSSSFKKKDIYCRYSCVGDSIEICYSRPSGIDFITTDKGNITYTGEKCVIYKYCDIIRHFREIMDYIRGNCQLEFSEEQLMGILDEFVDRKLMLKENDKYLSLAVYCSAFERE